MNVKLSACELRVSGTYMGARRRSAHLMHGMGLLLVAMLIAVGLSGCTGSSSTPTAHDQLCTNLSNLQDSIHNLLTVKNNEDFTTFKNEWNQVKTDFNDVKTSAQNVADANMNPITDAFNAFATSVQSALLAPNVSVAISTMKTATENLMNALSTAVSDLKCS